MAFSDHVVLYGWMVGKVNTPNFHLLTRRCVACGYDGVLLRGGAAPHCPRCGCNLAERPARSYAEMEGLLGTPLDSDGLCSNILSPRQERLISRWLAFAFLTMIGFLAMIYLSASALAL